MAAPVLLVLAAGMGSRYGGLKQADPLTERGEFLLDFTCHDALKAGFGRVVFIIRREHKELFDETIGARVAAAADVSYAFQEPDGLPPGRSKPWGTAHAVLSAREALGGEAFATVNADDFYGFGSLKLAADFLRDGQDSAVVAFSLQNTLTEHGAVSRGECVVSGGLLTGLTERLRVERRPDVGTAWQDDAGAWHTLPPDTPVSMNLFALRGGFVDYLAESFPRFLKDMADPLKSEFLLPTAVAGFIGAGGTVRVLVSPERWFGVTYPQDKPAAQAAVAALRERGVYPERLFAAR
jgi:hypothetical protein